MALTQLPVITLPEVDPADYEESLKIKSTKQLPQSSQIPNMYNRQFTSTRILDVNMVIRAVRADLETMQDFFYDPDAVTDESIVAYLNELRTAMLQTIICLQEVDVILDDHEARITALETP